MVPWLSSCRVPGLGTLCPRPSAVQWVVTQCSYLMLLQALEQALCPTSSLNPVRHCCWLPVNRLGCVPSFPGLRMLCGSRACLIEAMTSRGTVPCSCAKYLSLPVCAHGRRYTCTRVLTGFHLIKGWPLLSRAFSTHDLFRDAALSLYWERLAA